MNFDDEDDIWNPDETASETGSEAGSSSRVKKKPKKSAAARGSKGRKSSSSSNTMSSVNAEFLDDIKATFDRFDVEKSGKFETKQLKFALRALGFEPKKEEIKRITEEFDKDGYITSADFVSLMTKRMTEKTVNEEIMKAFQLFDESHSGKITFNDLKRVANELGENITDDELLEMIEEADTDGDHAVNCQDFLRIMKKTSLY